MAAIIMSASPRGGYEDYPLMLRAPSALYDLFDSCDFQMHVHNEAQIQAVVLGPPTPSGRTLILRGTSLRSKFDALKLVLREFDRVGESHEIVFFIPEGLVPRFIGTQGRGVLALQSQTSTQIQVGNTMESKDREVRISGTEEAVRSAVEMLHRKVVEYQPAAESGIKFAIPQSCAAHLIGKGGSFTKALLRDFDVELKVSSDPVCKERELSAILLGKKPRCLEALDEVVKKMEEAIYNSDTPKNGSKTFMLLRADSESQLNEVARGLKKDLDVTIRLYEPEDGEFRVEISGELRRRQKAVKVLLGVLEKPHRRHRSRSRSPASRTSVNIAVPKAMVGKLIGRSGENVKMLKGKSGCHISFMQQELKEVKTAEGGEARVCNVTGRPKDIAQAARLLWEQILKFESPA